MRSPVEEVIEQPVSVDGCMSQLMPVDAVGTLEHGGVKMRMFLWEPNSCE